MVFALSLCLASVCSAFAADVDISSGKYYEISSAYYSTQGYKISSDGTTLTRVTTTSGDYSLVFQFQQVEGTTDEWIIRHLQTGKYVGVVTKSTAIPVVTQYENAEHFYITQNEDGTFAFSSKTTAASTAASTQIYSFIHCPSDRSVIVGWEVGTSASSASCWNLTEATGICNLTVTYHATNSDSDLGPFSYMVQAGSTFNGQTISEDFTTTVNYTDGGDYRFLNYQGWNNSKTLDFIYADVTNGKLIQSTASEANTSDNTKFKVLEYDDGTFSLYSEVAQQFVGEIPTEKSPVELTSNPASIATLIKTYHSTNGAYVVGNSSVSDESTKQYLNAFGGVGNGSAVGGWSGEESNAGSHWFIFSADRTEEVIDNLTKYYTSYATNLSTAKSLMQVINDSADKMYSNMPHSSEGAHIEYLCDDDLSTYFHSDYSNYNDGVVHNLILKLPEDNTATNFTVQYARRQSSYYADPIEYVIYGSTDSESALSGITDWSEVCTIKEEDGLGENTGTFSFDTKGHQYAALRFDVTKTRENYGGTIRLDETHYFNLATFKLYALPDASLFDVVSALSEVNFSSTAASAFKACADVASNALQYSLLTDNTERYTISNSDGRGYLTYNADDKYLSVSSTLEADNADFLWSLVRHNGKNVLYNHGARLFANAFGDRNNINNNAEEDNSVKEYHDYSWRLSDVPTELQIKRYGESTDAVCVIGGVYSGTTGPGMSVFTNRYHPVVVCNGAAGETDGNGWVFTPVTDAATADAIDTLLDDSEKAQTQAQGEYDKYIADADENVIGNITPASQQAMRNFCSENIGYDAVQYSLTLANRISLVNDDVYHVSVADKYYCVNESDKLDLMDYDSAKDAYFNWKAVELESGTGFQLVHYIKKADNENTGSASGNAVKRRATETQWTYVPYALEIDGVTEFTDITYPALGVTQLTSGGTSLIITKNDGNAETVTALDEITVDGNGAAADIYDLQGRRVCGAIRPGLYIVGGRLIRR